MTTILGHILPERIRFTCITDPALSPPQWQAFNTATLLIQPDFCGCLMIGLTGFHCDRINRVSLCLVKEPAGLNQARII